MAITLTPHPSPFNVRNADASLTTAPRSPGVHLSAIIRKMALANGWLKPEYAADNLTDLINNTPSHQYGESGNLTRLALGFASEQWFVRQVRAWEPDLVYQPGEFIRDDIRVTPDALAFDADGFPVIHEFKLTYESARKAITSKIIYQVQILGYAAAIAPTLGMARSAYLHVVYVNGDYARGILWGPRYRVFKMTMEREDAEGTWEAIVANREGVTPEMGDEGGGE